MFNNIGEKLQYYAQVFTFIEIILAVIVGIKLIIGNAAGIGFLVLILGGMTAILTGWAMAGFGILVEAAENKQEKDATPEE